MLKKVIIKDSTIIVTGIIIILIGISIGFYEYFNEKKNKAFDEMSILLYETEIPEIIETDSSTVLEEETNIEEEIPQNTTEEIIKYLGILEIPKINLKNGFYGLNSKYNKVHRNVTVINGSTYPDQDKSNLILAAHSGNCPVCYFDKLYKLKLGDTAYVYYKGYKYSYEIVNIYEVEKDGTVAIYRDQDKSGLTLITCTRNNDTKQTVYILDLMSKEE